MNISQQVPTYLFRTINEVEIHQVIGFIEACFSGILSKEEYYAIHSQLSRSVAQDHLTSTYNIGCFSDGCLIGVGLYFIDYSTIYDSKTLTIEDIYIPQGKKGVTDAITYQLARIAVLEQCDHIAWSTLDYPFTGQLQPNTDQCGNIARARTYRLSGDALMALAGF